MESDGIRWNQMNGGRHSATGCPAARPRLRCGTLLLGSALMQSANLLPR